MIDLLQNADTRLHMNDLFFSTMADLTLYKCDCRDSSFTNTGKRAAVTMTSELTFSKAPTKQHLITVTDHKTFSVLPF